MKYKTGLNEKGLLALNSQVEQFVSVEKFYDYDNMIDFCIDIISNALFQDSAQNSFEIAGRYTKSGNAILLCFSNDEFNYGVAEE